LDDLLYSGPIRQNTIISWSNLRSRLVLLQQPPALDLLLEHVAVLDHELDRRFLRQPSSFVFGRSAWTCRSPAS